VSTGKVIRIGTRESQLALWQANEVKSLLETNGYEACLVHIKSEGDIDLVTPLYELGVQGIFTKTLDAALLNNRIDIAVHSMKDVPTQLAKGIAQAAVLPRASYRDIIAPRNGDGFLNDHDSEAVIATSSIRRRAQWLHRYPKHRIENLRGNVNTRLQKLRDSDWDGAIFAGAGLERIDLRPANALDLAWMLPAPAQGAIMVVAREGEEDILEACGKFNDLATALCCKIERDFLRALMGGCSTPISGLAQIEQGEVVFQGNIVLPDGSMKAEIAGRIKVEEATNLGEVMAADILPQGGQAIIEQMRNAR
jgi:hydroxymethylbilane synthase